MKNFTLRLSEMHRQLLAMAKEIEELQRELGLRTVYRADIPTEIAVIQKTVCDHYRISENVMVSKIRSDSQSRARFVAVYIIAHLTFFNAQEICECFGGRTHAWTLHAKVRCLEMMQQDQAFNNDVTELMRVAKDRLIEAHGGKKTVLFNPGQSTEKAS